MTGETKDIEMVYEDYDTCNSIHQHLANETNDFVDECILLLHLLDKPKKNSKHWASYLHKYSKYDSKHIIFYNWIALSLVRVAYADVTAVAVYRFKDGPARVYYAKNNLNSEDDAHAKEFADLIRLTASTKMSVDEFRTQYFTLIQKNCFGKLKRRVDSLRASVSFQEKPADGNLRVTPSQGEQFRDLLKKAINQNTVPSFNRNRADQEALALNPDTPNVFVALLSIFDSMKMYMIKEENADMLEELCGHCWIIGSSGIIEELTKNEPAAHDVVLTAQKLGEYYRGTGRLFVLLGDESTRALFSTFEFFAVPPTPNRNVELSKNWFHVIETIYGRVEGRKMYVSKGKLFAELQGKIIAYTKYGGGFIRHAEIDLIKYLMNNNLPPTVIGISKLSCILCNAWIDSLNKQNAMKWRVSGCHGRFYAWARDVEAGPMTAAAEVNVKNVVYQQLVELISEFIPDGGESPAQHDDMEDQSPPARLRVARPPVHR
jgi:hypothetical protein